MAKKKTIKYLENGEYHDATVKDVGVIEELKTESKDNLVEAINEIFLGGGKGFSDLQQKVDESTQAAQNAQQATDNLQQKLDEVAQNIGISDEEAQKIINQAIEDAKKAQAEALQAYKDAQKELDDSMAQFMEEQKAINKELEQAKTDIQGDIDQKNAEIEQINAVIESTKSDLTATSARLASVRNDLSNAQMDWGKVRQEITNINGKLDSKMSNTDFDEYKERIERNETEITQTKNELQSKATKQDLDVLTGTVTTQGSSITQLAGKIEQKVSKDTLANDIDDFQVKKANIFTGTREFMGWEFSDKALGRVNDDIYNHAKVAELHNGSNLSITVNGLEVGKTYSVSIFAKASANSNTSGVKVTVDNGKSYSGLMRTVYTPHDTKVTTNWQRYYATIVASATTMKFVFDRSGITSDITLYLNRPKLEVGETVYTWEDNAQDIYKRVEHTEAQFDVYNDQISGIVKRQTETDKKIENVSSTFTQRADGIEANAKKYTNDKVTGLTEEFSGKLKATSQELSTEYEKQTNAKIGALSDGGSNLILNSSFLVTDNNGNATLENWRDTSSKISLTKPNGLDGTWIKINRATTGTTLGARSNYFPVKQGKLVVGVDVALDGTGNISPYVLRIEYYDASNNRVNYEDITLQKLGLSASQITKSGSNFRYARGVYKTSNDRSDVAKACIVVPETITGYDMYLTNFFAKFSDVNDGTYEVNPLDQQASLIKQRTKIEQDSEKINLLNTQTEKLGNDIKATNTSVNVLKGEVDLKASQSTVNDLTNRVSKNEADIKVFPDKIKSEVREVSKKVDGVNDKVDNIKVGGTNLVRNSAHDPSGLEHWITNGVGKIWYGTHSFFRNGTTKMFFLNNPNTDKEMTIQTEYMDIEPDTDYTLSMFVFGASGVSSGDVYYNIKYADGSNTYFIVDGRFKYNPYRAERKAYKFHTSPNSSGSKATQVFIRVDNNGLIPGYSDGTIMLGDVKLEKGNIATDWSPAPEDTNDVIEEVKSVATQTKDGFERLTQKTGYNASTGEFAKVTTQINEGIKGVSSEVKSVSNRLDNLSVGGTNLAKHTSNTLTNRMRVSEWVYIASSGNASNFNLDNYKGQTLTMRAWIDKPTVDAHLQVWTNASNNAYAVGNTIKAGQSGYSSLTFNVPASFTTWNIPIGNGKAAELAYKEFKIEKGTIATDWSPAPEDLQAGIDIATTKATQTDTKFERMISQIQYNNSTGEIGKYEHKITELANGTQEKISAIRLDGDKKLQSATQTLTNKIGDLESTVRTNTTNIGQYRQEMTNSAKELSTKFTSVQNNLTGVSNRLDNLSVGGTNLLSNSGNPQNTDGWYANGSTDILTVAKHPYWKNGQKNLFLLINKNTNGNEAMFGSDVIKVDRNTDYTLSYWAFEDSYVPNSDTYFLGRKNGETSNFTIVKQLVRERKYSGGHAEYVSVTFNTGDIDEGYIRFDNNGNSGGNQSGLYIANIKLEKGNVATDWSPAPKDLQARIDIATTKATQTDTKFERMISQIQYNDSTGKIGKYEHKITELANGTQEKISALTKRGNNMVIKSSFDDGTDLGGWYVASVYGTDFYRATTTPKPDEMSSNYCLASGTRDALEANNIFPVVSGTKYYISAWVYTSRKYSGKVGLYVKNSNNNNVTHLGVAVPKDNQNRWIKIKGTITIPNGYNTAQPWLQVEKMVSDNEKIYFADISITRADDNAIELSETMTTRIGDLERTVRTNTTNIGQYRQEMTNSAKGLEVKLTSYQNLVLNDITGVKNKVDNIQVGGTNLVANGGNQKNTDGWSIAGSNPNHKLIVWSHPFWKNSQENLLSLFNQNSTEVTMSSKRIKVERNTDYTLSYWAFADWRVVSSDTFFLGRKNGETADFTKINNLVSGRMYSGSRAEYVSVTFNTGDIDEGYIRFDNNGSKEVGKDAVLFLANIKLEKGNKATDWSPAPEDTDNKIEILQGQITANANKFNTVYTKADVDNKINPLNSRTEFLQDNSQFLLRVTQAGGATKADVNSTNSKISGLTDRVGATQADVNSANSKISGLTDRVKSTEVAITSGGVTINGNTKINGDLNVDNIALKGEEAEIKISGDSIQLKNLNNVFSFSNNGLSLSNNNVNNSIIIGSDSFFSNWGQQSFTILGDKDGIEMGKMTNSAHEILGRIAVTQLDPNINGIGVVIEPQQVLGGSYGGDIFTISRTQDLTGTSGNPGGIYHSMIYDAVGKSSSIGRYKGFTFQDGFRVIPPGAGNGIAFGWVQFGSGYKTPAIVNSGSSYGGVAFPRDGNTYMFNTNSWWDGSGKHSPTYSGWFSEG